MNVRTINILGIALHSTFALVLVGACVTLVYLMVDTYYLNERLDRDKRIRERAARQYCDEAKPLATSGSFSHGMCLWQFGVDLPGNRD